MSSAPSSPESPRQIVRSNSNSPPTQVLPPPPPPIDLRHMTSNQGLASSSAGGRRTSQHFLRTTDTRGLGSPNSIPSSPTSIHSSSSAIFERDIEPILISPSSPPHSSSLFGPPPLPLSPASATSHPHVTSVSSTHSTSHSPHKPVDPHRIPRAKATEQLEQSVPSVLDSAAAILTNLSSEADQDAVQVVAPGTLGFAGFDSLILGGGPAASFGSGGSIVSPGGGVAGGAAHGRAVVRGVGTGSGFASPLSLRSRSPSPGGKSPSASGAGAAPVQGLLNIPSPVVSPHVLSSATTSSPPQPDGKTAASPSPAGSPRLSTSPPPPLSATTNATTTSHPPSPTHAPTKRLSFMSYSDLLSSTPTSTHTLSSLTTSASTFEPPPHIPVVSGLNIASAVAASVGSASASPSVSKAGSVRGVSLSGSVVGPPPGGLTHPGMRESIALLDNIGGEWEREGMGKGLEERLEELSVMSSAASVGGGSPLSLRGGLPNVNVVTAGGVVVQGKEVEVGKA